MGICISCTSSSSKLRKNIRVVHLNGHVEDFEEPTTVRQVTGDITPPKLCLWTKAQLLSPIYSKPLTHDTRLQPGNIYYLLPFSTFCYEVSPVDMAYIVHKLTKIGKSTKLAEKNCSSQVSETPADESGISVARSSRSARGSWKPFLDTIREISFNRRSESDLRD